VADAEDYISGVPASSLRGVRGVTTRSELEDILEKRKLAVEATPVPVRPKVKVSDATSTAIKALGLEDYKFGTEPWGQGPIPASRFTQAYTFEPVLKNLRESQWRELPWWKKGLSNVGGSIPGPVKTVSAQSGKGFMKLLEVLTIPLSLVGATIETGLLLSSKSLQERARISDPAKFENFYNEILANDTGFFGGAGKSLAYIWNRRKLGAHDFMYGTGDQFNTYGVLQGSWEESKKDYLLNRALAFSGDVYFDPLRFFRTVGKGAKKVFGGLKQGDGLKVVEQKMQRRIMKEARRQGKTKEVAEELLTNPELIRQWMREFEATGTLGQKIIGGTRINLGEANSRFGSEIMQMIEIQGRIANKPIMSSLSNQEYRFFARQMAANGFDSNFFVRGEKGFTQTMTMAEARTIGLSGGYKIPGTGFLPRKALNAIAKLGGKVGIKALKGKKIDGPVLIPIMALSFDKAPGNILRAGLSKFGMGAHTTARGTSKTARFLGKPLRLVGQKLPFGGRLSGKGGLKSLIRAKQGAIVQMRNAEGAIIPTPASHVNKAEAREVLHAVGRGHAMGRASEGTLRRLGKEFQDNLVANGFKNDGKGGQLIAAAMGGDTAAIAAIKNQLLRQGTSEEAADAFVDYVNSFMTQIRNIANEKAGIDFLGAQANYRPRFLSKDARDYFESIRAGSLRRNHKKDFEPAGFEKTRKYVDADQFEELVQVQMAKGKSREAAEEAVIASGRISEIFGRKLFKPGSMRPDGTEAPDVERQIADIMTEMGLGYSLFVDNVFEFLMPYMTAMGQRIGEVYTEDLLKRAGVFVDRTVRLQTLPNRKVQKAWRTVRQASMHVEAMHHEIQEVIDTIAKSPTGKLKNLNRELAQKQAILEIAERRRLQMVDELNTLVDDVSAEEAKVLQIKNDIDDLAEEIAELSVQITAKVNKTGKPLSLKQASKLEKERQEIQIRLNQLYGDESLARFNLDRLRATSVELINLEATILQGFGSTENFMFVTRLMKDFGAEGYDLTEDGIQQYFMVSGNRLFDENAGDAGIFNSVEMIDGGMWNVTMPDGNVLNQDEFIQMLNKGFSVMEELNQRAISQWLGVEMAVDDVAGSAEALSGIAQLDVMMQIKRIHRRLEREVNESTQVLKDFVTFGNGKKFWQGEVPTVEEIINARANIVNYTQQQLDADVPIEQILSSPEIASAVDTFYGAYGKIEGISLNNMGDIDDVLNQLDAALTARGDEITQALAGYQDVAIQILPPNGSKATPVTVGLPEYVRLQEMKQAMKVVPETRQMPFNNARLSINDLLINGRVLGESSGRPTQQAVDQGVLAGHTHGQKIEIDTVEGVKTFFVKQYNETGVGSRGVHMAPDPVTGKDVIIDTVNRDVLANALYREMGFGAPASYISEDSNKVRWVISEWIDVDYLPETIAGALQQTTKGGQAVARDTYLYFRNGGMPEIIDDITRNALPKGEVGNAIPLAEIMGKGTLMDMFLANVDAIGSQFQNVGFDKAGRLVRIDNGESLIARHASGERWIPEDIFDSLENLQNYYAMARNRIYTGESWEKGKNQLMASWYDKTEQGRGFVTEMNLQFDNLNTLRKEYGGWRNLVDRHLPDASPENKDYFVNFLESRTEQLAKIFGQDVSQGSKLVKEVAQTRGASASDVDRVFNQFDSKIQSASQKLGYEPWVNPHLDSEVPVSQAIGKFNLLDGSLDKATKRTGSGLDSLDETIAETQGNEAFLKDVKKWVRENTSDKGERLDDFLKDRGVFNGNPHTSGIWDEFFDEEVLIKHAMLVLDDNGNVIMRLPVDNPRMVEKGHKNADEMWEFAVGGGESSLEDPVAGATGAFWEQTGLHAEAIDFLPNPKYGADNSQTFFFIGRLKKGQAVGTKKPKVSTRPVDPFAEAVDSVPENAIINPVESTQLTGDKKVLDDVMTLFHTSTHAETMESSGVLPFVQTSWGNQFGINAHTPPIIMNNRFGYENVQAIDVNVGLTGDRILVYGQPTHAHQQIVQAVRQQTMGNIGDHPTLRAAQLDLDNATTRATSFDLEMPLVKRPRINEADVSQEQFARDMDLDQWERVFNYDRNLFEELKLTLKQGKYAKSFNGHGKKAAETFDLVDQLADLDVALVNDMSWRDKLTFIGYLEKTNSDPTVGLLKITDDAVGWNKDLATDEVIRRVESNVKRFLAMTDPTLTPYAWGHRQTFESASETIGSVRRAKMHMTENVRFKDMGLDVDDLITNRVSRFYDTYRRSTSAEGYTAAVWMNHESFNLGATGDVAVDTYGKAFPSFVLLNPMAMRATAREVIQPDTAIDIGQVATNVKAAKEELAQPNVIDVDSALKAYEQAWQTAILDQKKKLLSTTVDDTVEALTQQSANRAANLNAAKRRLDDARTAVYNKKAQIIDSDIARTQLKQEFEILDKQVEQTVVRAKQAVAMLEGFGTVDEFGRGIPLEELPEQLAELKIAVGILMESDAEAIQMALRQLDEGAEAVEYLKQVSAFGDDTLYFPLKKEMANEKYSDFSWQVGYRPFGVNSQGPDHIVEAMMGVQNFKDRGGWKSFWHHYDRVHNLTKGYMIMKPGFHMRNFYSAVWMNYLDDVSFSSYREFQRAYWTYQYETALTQNMPRRAEMLKKALRAHGIRGQGKSVPRENVDIIARLDQEGLLGGAQGQIGVEFAPEAGALRGKIGKALRAINPASSRNAPLRLSRNAGMGVETYVRGTMAFDSLKRGDSPSMAFERVMKFHFDYSDLAEWEKKLKRVVPFYVWTRRNFPLMLEQVTQRPTKFTTYTKAKANIERGIEDDDAPIPPWMVRGGAIRLPIKFQGEHMFILPDLPFKTPMEMLNPIFEDGSPIQKAGAVSRILFSQVTPLMKAPVEAFFKQNLWKGYTFSGKLQQVPTIYKKVPFLMNMLDVAGVAEKNNQGIWLMKDHDLHAMAQALVLFSDMRRLAPSEEKYQQRTLSTWMSFAFGLGLRTNTKWEQEQTIKGMKANEKASKREKQRRRDAGLEP
tara:strand:+ start:624 stop:9569 length:8946 start_codon:yes stop_codon:yes gene_type:complete